jgi:hypothetical protein
MLGKSDFLLDGYRVVWEWILSTGSNSVGVMGDWHYAGERPVTSEGKIRIPERLFEKDILHPDRAAYWSYEVSVGFLLVSDTPLVEKERYKPQGMSPIGPESEGYKTNIPKVFFNDYKGSGRGDDESPVPRNARVEYGEKRFFAFRESMAEGDTKSCYLFTGEQFDNTIGDDDWADPLSEIPRFS